jgi:signal recognition particle GTPase
MQKVLEQNMNQLMKQFEQMSKMMKMMQGPGGKNLMKMMGGMKGMPGGMQGYFRFKDSLKRYFKPFFIKQTTTKP